MGYHIYFTHISSHELVFYAHWGVTKLQGDRHTDITWDITYISHIFLLTNLSLTHIGVCTDITRDITWHITWDITWNITWDIMCLGDISGV